MMYEELYNAWKQEKASEQLQPVRQTFYREISQYIRDLKERLRALDQKTLQGTLLREELAIAIKLFSDLMTTRSTKITHLVERNGSLPVDLLTEEEGQLSKGIAPALQSYRETMNALAEGHEARAVEAVQTEGRKKALVRLLTEVPAIVGVDLKTYGPFKAEDVASLPAENVIALVRQGVAKKIEVKSRS